MNIRKASFVVAFAAVLGFASLASAQSGSSWGASFDVTPHWETMSLLNKFLNGDNRLEGREVKVGLVRGRIRGGDWGVALVRQEVNDSSYQRERRGSSSSCRGSSNSMICVNKANDSELYFNDAFLLGVEFHKYVPFVAIAKRVQIGINFGGGAMLPKGSAEKHLITTQTITQNGEVIDSSQSRTTEVITAEEAFKDILGLSVIPTGRVEAVVGIIVTEHVKVKAGGGVNFPGQHKFTVGATYLF